MIRKHLYTLYVMKRRQEIAQPYKILILIRNTRNEHMSDPYRFVYLTQISGTIQNIGVTMTRQFAISSSTVSVSSIRRSNFSKKGDLRVNS